MQSVPTTPDYLDNSPRIALAVKVSPIRRRGVLTHWLITVECPNGCKRGHVHGSGGPTLRHDHGSRVAHCPGHKGGDYTVIIPADLLAQATRSTGGAA
jgi:hypothetical protein